MKRRRESEPDTRSPGVGAAEGSSAKLRARDGIDWPVRMSRRDGDELMLVLLAKSDGVELSSGDTAPNEPLMLECTSDHGVVRFPGDAQLEEPDLVRFRVRDVPQIEQRREYVRVRAPRQVVLAVSGTRHDRQRLLARPQRRGHAAERARHTAARRPHSLPPAPRLNLAADSRAGTRRARVRRGRSGRSCSRTSPGRTGSA